MSDGTGQVLLDTHVWLWLISGDEKPTRSPSLPVIKQASSASSVLVSAISVWEVAMLEAKGRVDLERDCMAWVTQALSAPGVSLTPLTPQIAVASTRLPGGFHGEPADRIIVATARALDATVVTRDKRIMEYGGRGLVEALRA